MVLKLKTKMDRNGNSRFVWYITAQCDGWKDGKPFVGAYFTPLVLVGQNGYKPELVDLIEKATGACAFELAVDHSEYLYLKKQAVGDEDAQVSQACREWECRNNTGSTVILQGD